MSLWLGILGGQITLTATNAIAVAHSNTPYITAYPWSAGFGTKYADPATLPPSIGRSVAFSS